jgi:hypothetical protein
MAVGVIASGNPESSRLLGGSMSNDVVLVGMEMIDNQILPFDIFKASKHATANDHQKKAPLGYPSV